MHLSRFILFLSTICLAALASIPHPLPAQDPTPRPTFVNEHSDLNQDNVVDAEDLLILLQDWGVTSGPRPTLTQTYTPTPTTTPTAADFEVITIPLPNLPEGARPLRLVHIPSGTFQMGSPDTERGRRTDEGPVHTVDLDYHFFMGETEVTQAQWQAIMGSNPASGFGLGNDYPVYFVSFTDILRSNGFLERLNALGQGTFRLPSEAEWEYACRAGTTTRFSFGDTLACDDRCGSCAQASQSMWWCGNNSPYGSKPVGEKTPNVFGLFDMHGNVREWCQDYWHDSYVGAPTDGSPWLQPTTGGCVVRGGGWYFDANYCRSADRGGVVPPNQSYLGLGFRVVMSVSSKSF